MKKKSIALLMACALVFGVTVGGTMAWLTAETQDVVNTFTVGDINIELTETGISGTNGGTQNFNFVPGDTLAKDPKVTVTAGSEACYLFVKVEEVENTQDGLTGKVINWTMRNLDTNTNPNPNEAWVAYSPSGVTVPGGTFYYYRKVDASEAKEDISFFLLKGHDETNTNCAGESNCTCPNTNGYVTVNPGITKEMVDNTTTGLEENKPMLSFTAAAVQLAHIDTVDSAWNELPADFKPRTGNGQTP